MCRIAHLRLSIVIASLLGSLIIACGSATGPGGSGGPIFGGIGGLSGGYSGGGFIDYGQKLDTAFDYLYPGEFTSGAPWNCDTDGYCSVGGVRNDFGAIVEPDSFLFVSSANVVHNGALRVVRNSGIQSHSRSIANASTYSAVRLSFEFVFATARFNSTTHNDSAIIRIKAGTDSATIFKVTTADLQGAKYAMRTGGCGTVTIIDLHPIAYPNCTAWIPTTADITAYKGRSFVLQFIVAEGSQLSTDFVDQPSAFLFRKVQFEAAK
jgi:hypothetical protein